MPDATKPTDSECLEVLIHIEDQMWDQDAWVLQRHISASVRRAPAMAHLNARGVPTILRHLEAEGYAERKPGTKDPIWRPTVTGLHAIRTLRYPVKEAASNAQ